MKDKNTEVPIGDDINEWSAFLDRDVGNISDDFSNNNSKKIISLLKYKVEYRENGIVLLDGKNLIGYIKPGRFSDGDNGIDSDHHLEKKYLVIIEGDDMELY